MRTAVATLIMNLSVIVVLVSTAARLDRTAGIAATARRDARILDARIDSLAKAVARLDDDVHAAHRRIDEAAKLAHDRRAVQADELRREIAAAISDAKGDVGRLRLDLAVEFEECDRRIADLSRRLDDESDIRALVCESLFQGDDALRIALAIFGDEVERLKQRKAEVVRHETVKVVERVVDRPIYVQVPAPVYLLPVPTRICR